MFWRPAGARREVRSRHPAPDAACSASSSGGQNNSDAGELSDVEPRLAARSARHDQLSTSGTTRTSGPGTFADVCVRSFEDPPGVRLHVAALGAPVEAQPHAGHDAVPAVDALSPPVTCAMASISILGTTSQSLHGVRPLCGLRRSLGLILAGGGYTTPLSYALRSAVTTTPQLLGKKQRTGAAGHGGTEEMERRQGRQRALLDQRAAATDVTLPSTRL